MKLLVLTVLCTSDITDKTSLTRTGGRQNSQNNRTVISRRTQSPFHFRKSPWILQPALQIFAEYIDEPHELKRSAKPAIKMFLIARINEWTALAGVVSRGRQLCPLMPSALPLPAAALHRSPGTKDIMPCSCHLPGFCPHTVGSAPALPPLQKSCRRHELMHSFWNNADRSRQRANAFWPVCLLSALKLGIYQRSGCS